MPIPDSIRREHVLEAIRLLDLDEPHGFGDPPRVFSSKKGQLEAFVQAFESSAPSPDFD